jgi:hypothetical protein
MGDFRLDRSSQILAKTFTESNPGWRASRSCLGDIASLTQSYDIRLIVIPFPVLAGVSAKPYPFAGYVQTVCDAAKALGAECLDVFPVLSQANFPLIVSSVERHPSAAVHRAVAAQLAEALSATVD